MSTYGFPHTPCESRFSDSSVSNTRFQIVMWLRPERLASRGRLYLPGEVMRLKLKVNIRAENENKTLPQGPHLQKPLTLHYTDALREPLHRCERTAASLNLRDRCRELRRVPFYGLLSVAVTVRKSRLMHFKSSPTLFFFHPQGLRVCGVYVTDDARLTGYD